MGGMDLIDMAQGRDRWVGGGSCEYRNEPSVFTKFGEFLD